MKTIEEAAKEYELYSMNNLSGAFKAGIEFAQRWISVKDELPETNEFEESKIILIKGKRGIDIGRYYSRSKHFFLASGNFEVTHWRYIELIQYS